MKRLRSRTATPCSSSSALRRFLAPPSSPSTLWFPTSGCRAGAAEPIAPWFPPIIVITAFGGDEVHQRAKEAGAVTVLDQPFEIQDLLKLGRRVIGQRSVANDVATAEGA
jgi:hypothetical protein